MATSAHQVFVDYARTELDRFTKNANLAHYRASQVQDAQVKENYKTEAKNWTTLAVHMIETLQSMEINGPISSSN